jgi:membrane-bound lytic murein transglycosylase B
MEYGMFLSLLKTIIVYLAVGQVFADAKMLEQADVKSFISEMVTRHHFKAEELRKILTDAQFKPVIIEKMTTPYEAKPWDVYQQLFLTPGRIKAGQDFWKAHAKTLSLAEKTYGVPANIIVAILGVETIYGQRQGDFRVLDALSTLAFYFPKRAPYFKYELVNYLLMCRENHLNPSAQLGSYAGAMGQGQFMPSSYRRFAVKFQGEGAPDAHEDLAALVENRDCADRQRHRLGERRLRRVVCHVATQPARAKNNKKSKKSPQRHT